MVAFAGDEAGAMRDFVYFIKFIDHLRQRVFLKLTKDRGLKSPVHQIHPSLYAP